MKWIFVLSLTIGAFGASAFGFIENPENDPDLAQALKYDYLANATGTGPYSRALAEKFYLKYLSRTEDIDQQARIYFRIGYMYGVGARKEQGEPQDIPQAERYFSKALEVNPDGLSLPTIYARSHWACSVPTDTERLDRHVKAYADMIRLTTLDPEEHVMLQPSDLREGREVIEPGVYRVFDPEQARRRRVEQVQKLLKSAKRTLMMNTAYRATEAPNPKAALTNLIRRFPNDPIAKQAKRELERLNRKTAIESHEAAIGQD